jgi:hypothetical protein
VTLDAAKINCHPDLVQLPDPNLYLYLIRMAVNIGTITGITLHLMCGRKVTLDR